jgi:DNA replication licensing factor MCM4
MRHVGFTSHCAPLQVLDKPCEIMDGRLAQHLIELYFKELPPRAVGTYDVKTLTRFVGFARKNVHPKLTPAASEILVKQYVDMRQQGVRNKTVTSVRWL